MPNPGTGGPGTGLDDLINPPGPDDSRRTPTGGGREGTVGNNRRRGPGGPSFPNFNPASPWGPPPNVLGGQGFMPWAPIMPDVGGGGWSGQQGFGMPGMGGGGGFPGMPGGGGMQPGGAGPFAPAGAGMGGGINAFQTYLSAVPVMEAARDKNISEAMAGAGFGGNRFGTAAMNQAGQIGASTAMQQNQLLTNLLRDETQATMDRGLQATGMGIQNEQFRNELALRAAMGDRDAMAEASRLGMQLGGMQDQQMQDRIRLLQGFGSQEQGRQDQFANAGLNQFNQDRLGTWPMILQSLGRGGSGTPQSPIQTSQGGSPSTMDQLMPIITTAIMAFALASDERLKTNIHQIGELPVHTARGTERVRLVEWDWKDGSGHAAGVIAQELEPVLPEAVVTGADGYLAVRYGLLFANVLSKAA